MMVLDRKTPPAAGDFRMIPLPDYSVKSLDNGIQVYLLPYGQVEVVQIEALYRAGRNYQPKVGLGDYMAKNMTEGTASYTSVKLAHKLDGLGAFIGHHVGEEALSLKLLCLTDQLPETLPLFKEVVFQPTFPESEFTQMKARAAQRLKVEAEKTTFQARRHFKQALFGSHPYGTSMGLDELAALELSDLQTYHTEKVMSADFSLLVVGRYDEARLLAQLNSTLGQQPRHTLEIPAPSAAVEMTEAPTGRQNVSVQGVQSTVRVGHRGLDRSHPDQHPMTLVNTILGGYYGSRLMKKIREEKGYTYGVYSLWSAYQFGGQLAIQTDVANEYVADTLATIRAEMHRLQDDGVDKAELQLVKNYLAGQSISQRETPAQMGGILRFALVNGYSFADLDARFMRLQALSTEEVQRLAQAHLRPEALLEVVAGN
ncbi:MAG: pitrilysin family protein [Bacteroidota bacterium]